MVEKGGKVASLVAMGNAKLAIKKRNSMKKAAVIERGNLFDFLPVDVITEILLRLSAADVVMIRHVCKQFAQLSWQPSFVSLHMKRHNTDAAGCLIMHLNSCPNLDMLEGLSKLPILGKANIMIDLHASQLVNYQCSSTFLKIPKIFGYCLDYLEATCDGLLCFKKRNHNKEIASFAIGNPLTREWMSVSVPTQTCLVPTQTSRVSVFGFYFHASSGKYKLLLQFRSFCVDENNTVMSYAVVELVPVIFRPINYSIAFHPFINRICCHGPVLIHGNLHWIGYQVSKKLIRRIVVFNMEKEQFSQILIPRGFSTLIDVRLFEFEGKLCLLKLTSWPDVDVCVLEDYKKGIWIEKKAVIRTVPCDIQEQTYKFVAYIKNHLLLLKPGFCDTEFTFYYKEVSNDFVFLYSRWNASILLGQKYNKTLASFGMQRQMLMQPLDSC